MNSRDLMRAVLTFNNPPRVGMTLQPESTYPHDFCWRARAAHLNNVPLEPQGNEIKRWRDEWGCIWATLTTFDKGEVVEGAITDWSQLDAYQPPNLGNIADYKIVADGFASSDRFRVCGIPGFTFNISRYIRKLEHYLCDLIIERENIDRLHAMVRAQLLNAIDCAAAAGADAIMFPEDWGTQDRLMVSPTMWREIFKPEFQALCGRAHKHGMFVIMHSCGMITEIIDDLIECGVNCLQFDQPRLHGIETLSNRFGGRVTFWCPVDIQKTLQTRDPKLIEEEAHLLIEKLGCFGGGFIAGYYNSNEALGLPLDVQDIACKAFVKYGSMPSKS